jgi:hypothetical protein
MKFIQIKIIGSNSSNGMKIMKNLNKVTRELNLNFNIEIINSDQMKKYHINKIPALIIEGETLSEGCVPSEREIKNYIKKLCLN